MQPHQPPDHQFPSYPPFPAPPRKKKTGIIVTTVTLVVALLAGLTVLAYGLMNKDDDGTQISASHDPRVRLTESQSGQPSQEPVSNKLESQAYVDQEKGFALHPPKGSDVVRGDIKDENVAAGFLFMVVDPSLGDKFVGASIKVRVRTVDPGETLDSFTQHGKHESGKLLERKKIPVNGSDAVVRRLEKKSAQATTKVLELWTVENGKVYFVSALFGSIVPESPEAPAWQAFEDAMEESVFSFTVL